MKTGPSARTPACAWMTPLTTSPSLPAHSPYVVSCCASRSRLTITCFAVIAAMRPNPLGVSSHSRTRAPSSSSSCAKTRTSPLLRSSSTRACVSAASVCWYAARSALSIASTTVSKETSFSRTRLRSAVTSMFMGASPTRRSWARLRVVLVHVVLVRVACARPAELHLHLAWAEDVVRDRALRPVDVEGHPGLVGAHHAAGHVLVLTHTGADESPGRTPPVPGLSQWPVHTGRADLERVGHLAGHVVGIEDLGDHPGDVGDGVEVEPTVAVDDHSDDAAPAGGGDGDVLQVIARAGDDGLEDVAHPLPGDSRHDAHLPCSLVRASGRTGPILPIGSLCETARDDRRPPADTASGHPRGSRHPVGSLPPEAASRPSAAAGSRPDRLGRRPGCGARVAGRVRRPDHPRCPAGRRRRGGAGCACRPRPGPRRPGGFSHRRRRHGHGTDAGPVATGESFGEGPAQGRDVRARRRRRSPPRQRRRQPRGLRSVPSGRRRMTELDALQSALARLHEAVYGYGLAGAHLHRALRSFAAVRLRETQVLRDAVAAQVNRRGGTPTPAAPAYTPPTPVVDPASAADLLANIEAASAGAAWDLVAASEPDTRSRRLAVGWLSSAARAGFEWRAVAQTVTEPSATMPFGPSLPGQPG